MASAWSCPRKYAVAILQWKLFLITIEIIKWSRCISSVCLSTWESEYLGSALNTVSLLASHPSDKSLFLSALVFPPVNWVYCLHRLQIKWNCKLLKKHRRLLVLLGLLLGIWGAITYSLFHLPTRGGSILISSLLFARLWHWKLQF